jgi:hypothetical protein
LWLWQDGKDETGRAEQINIKALDELYEKRAEIPGAYFNSLSSDIFALLEANAKESAKKLRAKYNLSSEDELTNAYSLLNIKDGEKIAVDKLQRSLANKSELSPMTLWLMEALQSRKSPELLRILTEIVKLEESGRSSFSANTLFFAVDYFRNILVPNELRIRFYKVICNKAKNAVQIPDSDAKSIFELLGAVMEDIAKNAPGLLPEARNLQSIFMSRAPRATAETLELYRRVEVSPDPIGALISEAEASADKDLKSTLFVTAAQSALKKGRFRLSVELLDKAKENIGEGEEKEFSRWRDQFLVEVSDKALEKDDVESARYAAEKVIDKLTLANVWRKTAIYYYDKRDSVSAADWLERALKLASSADEGVLKISLLIRLISTAQKVDSSRVSEVAEKTAKAINLVPRPAADDKPETDNHKKYVGSIMAINERLMPVFGQLVKTNKNEAVDFAARINIKEVKLLLNYAFLVDSLRFEMGAG